MYGKNGKESTSSKELKPRHLSNDDIDAIHFMLTYATERIAANAEIKTKEDVVKYLTELDAWLLNRKK